MYRDFINNDVETEVQLGCATSNYKYSNYIQSTKLTSAHKQELLEFYNFANGLLKVKV